LTTQSFRPLVSREEAVFSVAGNIIHLRSDMTNQRIHVTIGSVPAGPVAHILKTVLEEVVRDYFRRMGARAHVVLQKLSAEGDWQADRIGHAPKGHPKRRTHLRANTA